MLGEGQSHVGDICSPITLPEPAEAPKKMAPDQVTQKAMGLKPGYAQRFADLHGGATLTHPFGEHVHAGLRQLADLHDPGYTPDRQSLWTLYGTQPNKAQMKVAYGESKFDQEGGARWWPATGFRELSGYRTKCIGRTGTRCLLGGFTRAESR